MEKSQQTRLAVSFLERHRTPPPLLLPNVWDPISARLFVAAGFDMVATTSGGVAWALGYPDGEVAPWPEVVAATRRIVQAARVAVSADIEAGYGTGPAEVEAHVAEIIRVGIVGINLEDGAHGSLRSLEDAVLRLRAARDASRAEGVPIVINARCDVYHVQPDGVETRFDETVERCRAYLAAGADCVYPFGLRDIATIAKLVKVLAAPVNVTGRPGKPPVEVLGRTGVARVTVAAAPALAAMAAVQALARDLRVTGSFEALETGFVRRDAQGLFSITG